jgi:hypothetical protein
MHQNKKVGMPIEGPEAYVGNTFLGKPNPHSSGEPGVSRNSPVLAHHAPKISSDDLKAFF